MRSFIVASYVLALLQVGLAVPLQPTLSALAVPGRGRAIASTTVPALDAFQQCIGDPTSATDATILRCAQALVNSSGNNSGVNASVACTSGNTSLPSTGANANANAGGTGSGPVPTAQLVDGVKKLLALPTGASNLPGTNALVASLNGIGNVTPPAAPDSSQTNSGVQPRPLIPNAPGVQAPPSAPSANNSNPLSASLVPATTGTSDPDRLSRTANVISLSPLSSTGTANAVGLSRLISTGSGSGTIPDTVPISASNVVTSSNGTGNNASGSTGARVNPAQVVNANNSGSSTTVGTASNGTGNNALRLTGARVIPGQTVDANNHDSSTTVGTTSNGTGNNAAGSTGARVISGQTVNANNSGPPSNIGTSSMGTGTVTGSTNGRVVSGGTDETPNSNTHPVPDLTNPSAAPLHLPATSTPPGTTDNDVELPQVDC